MTFIGRIFKSIIALLMIAGVAAAGVAIFLILSPVLAAPKPAVSTQPVTFTIKPGESVTDIANNLQNAGIIDSTLWFTLKLKTRGAEKSLQAGRFQLTPGEDLDQIVTTLSSPAPDIGVKLPAIIEGTRIEEIAEKLNAAGIVSGTTFLQLAGTPEGAATFHTSLLDGSGRPGDRGLEGYLFPDTYEIKQAEGDNSKVVIQTMLDQMDTKFTPEMRQKVKDRGLTIHQVLTVASIVQREGIVPEELPKIAAVFWNRLDKGMLLGADPTTQYAVAKAPDWWPNLDAHGINPNNVDDPYNTYTTHGLPPGPICNPSLAAITAAVYPDATDYLYFVAKNDGSNTHAFARTLEEHERNRVTYGNR